MSLTGELGRQAETVVADYLSSLGYRICARNYRIVRIGELDLVTWKDGRLMIVEVKARQNAAAFGGLPATITPAKIRRLQKTTWCYLKEKQLMNIDVSFLAALVQMDRDGKTVSIDLVPIDCV